MDIQGACLQDLPPLVRIKKSPHVKLSLCRETLSRAMQEVANSPGRKFRPSAAAASTNKLKEVKSSTEGIFEKDNSKLILPPAPPSARGYSVEQVADIKKLLKSYDSGIPSLDLKMASWADEITKEVTEQEAAIQLSKAIHVLDHKIKSDFDVTTQLEAHFDLQLKKITHKIQNSSEENELRLILAREASTLLITSKGHINYGLIPVIENFFDNHMQRNNFKINFVSFLEMLKSSEELRMQIADIPHPKKTNILGSDLIRSCLLMKPLKKIHSYHAKRCALMACLSYPRQGGVGNCFALAIAISLFSTSIEKCVGDFREILEYGYLKRYVEDKFVSFPILLRQPLFNVLKPLTSDIPSLLESKKVHFVLEQVGLELPAILPEVKTVDHLLTLLGPEAREKGRFLYESFFENPLLAVWINILASMAEGRSDGLIKSAIVKSCLIVAQEHGLDENEKEILRYSLIKRVYLHYDPSIMSINSSDESGAFILYEKRKGYFRVDGSEKFQTFLKTVSTSQVIAEWAVKPATLARIVGLYYGRKQDDSTMEQMDLLRRTPWKTELGNDPNNLLATYDNTSIPSLFHFQPKTVEELFHKIVSFWRAYKTIDLSQNNQSNIRRQHSSIHIPTRIVSLHSFNLILNDKNMHDCLLGDPETTLQNRKKLAIKLSEITVPLELYKRLKTYLLENYQQISPFIGAIPENATLAGLRDYLVTKFKDEYIDRKIFEFLPEGIKSEMAMQAIHFGDSNKQIDGKDIYYAFCYHPGSLKLSIFQQKESGELMSPLLNDDQNKLGNWEIMSGQASPQPVFF